MAEFVWFTLDNGSKVFFESAQSDLGALLVAVWSNCQDLWILGGPKPRADVTSGA